MNEEGLHAALRALPAVNILLELCQDHMDEYGHNAVVEAARTVLNDARGQILAGEIHSFDLETLLPQIHARLQRVFQPTLLPVINATGVIIHTNLGRAPLSEAAQQAMIAAAGYNTLEYDLDTGKRGSRLIHAEALLQTLTGAEATLVVNNNAAAIVLMLTALARDREVIVSRGQLVEIGGGFRVPDIMRQSGARLLEVGTTNRTRATDYEQAITEDTTLLMRVHASNFRQIGFTETASLAEMAEIAGRHGLYLVDDLGSGALIDTAAFGLIHEPTVQESVSAGCDVVAFSGDKLLGGPQAGILVGRRDLIELLKRHPLARALRADKLCLAALTATLDHYRRGAAIEQIPVLQMLARSLQEIQHLAERWAQQLGESAAVLDGESPVGGGSLPGSTLPTKLLALTVSAPDDFLAKLRGCDPPIIARIAEGQVILDPRTVFQHQEQPLLDCLRALL